jgi:membrane-associated phospholipid phosphatase
MAPIKKIIFWIAAYLIFLIVIALFLSRVLSLDQSLFLAINGLYNPYLETFFNIVTYLGSSVFWILLIVLVWLKGKKRMSLHLIYAFLINAVFVVVLKSIFQRPRPFDIFNLGFGENIGPSFPSGHSELAFSGAYVLDRKSVV